MGPTDYRLGELADEARVRPSHVHHLIAWLAAGNPADKFAAFARLEDRHVEQMLAALESHGLLPKPKRRRSGEAVQGQAHSTRLPALMQLPDDWLAYAQTRRKWDRATTEDVLADFIEHWSNRTDARAAKLDWFATWQTWVRRDRRPDGLWAPSTAPSNPDGVWLYQERKRLDSAPYDPEGEAEWRRRRDAVYAR